MRRVEAPPPDGLVYEPDFISNSQELELVSKLGQLEFSQLQMQGVVAKRRVAHFGWVYGYESWRLAPGPAIPEFLLPVRDEAARLAGINPSELVEVLVTKYPPGSGIGWHRDAPGFGPSVVGISLLASCKLRFRRGEANQRETFSLSVEPRSAYMLSGAARYQWQHSIPGVDALRYSITFRSLRRGKAEDKR